MSDRKPPVGIPDNPPIFCDRCEEKPATATLTMLNTVSLDAMSFLCSGCLAHSVTDWAYSDDKESYVIERMEGNE